MNAPTQLAHVTPEIKPRPAPPALIEALKSRFGAQFSEAMAVREALPATSCTVALISFMAEATMSVSVRCCITCCKVSSATLDT